MFRTTNTHYGTSGFTMTEVLTVVVLLGTAGAIAIPQFGGNTAQFAQTAVRSISHDIQYAQDLAVTTQSPITLSFDGFQYSLKNSSGEIITHPVNKKPYTVNLQDDPNISKLTIVVNFGESTSVVFDAFGAPSASGTITLSHSEMDSDVVLTLHGATGSVTVSQTP
jgi:prepilin-type N-terminal cleavage/methylation domain-containing protein